MLFGVTDGRVREDLLLIEGGQTPALIHDHLGDSDAARRAALILVQNDESTPAENGYGTGASDAIPDRG